MRSVYSIILLALFLSCQKPLDQETKNEKNRTEGNIKEGLVKTYDDSGNVHTEINYKAGLKHGKSLLYHDGSDQIMLEMNYENGKRSGIARKYYEDGKVYAETPYVDDEVSGIVKLYYRSGKLKAEVPYHQSNSGLGLKEYFTSGELKTDMPEIMVRKQRVENQYIYYFSIDDCTEANFFIGALLNNEYLIEKPPFVEVLPKRYGEGIYGFPESLIGETINVICKCRTTAKNPYVTRKVMELGE
ncbi:MAG: toxin-antitoxin system YwqK family antitoxin [Bacteroidota bacterium]